MTESNDTKEKRAEKKRILIACLFLLLILSFAAIAYANSAWVSSGNNRTSNDFVVITMTDSEGNTITDGILFDYAQDYDTYTDHQNNTVFRLLTDEREIRLHDGFYLLTISDSKGIGGTYSLSMRMPVPTLYETDVQENPCRFSVKLTDAETSEVYTAETSDSSAVDFDKEIPAGTYRMEISLNMRTVPSSHDDSDLCIQVDRTNFVDRFPKDDIRLTFSAVPAE